MSNTTDIKDLYKKRGLKKTFLRVFWLAVCIASVFGVYLVLNGGVEFSALSAAENLLDAVAGRSYYPAATSGGKVISLDSTGSSVVCLDENVFALYSRAGRKRMEFTHGYYRPIVRTGPGRALLFDQSGNEVIVTNETKEIFRTKFTTKIVNAVLGNGGNLAVVTDSALAAAEGCVYNDKFDIIYRWYNEKPVVSLAVSDVDNAMAVGWVDAVDGGLVSGVSIHRFYLEEIESKLMFPDELIIEIIPGDGGGFFLAITDKKIYKISVGGLKSGEYSFDSEMLWAYDASPENGITVALGNYDDSRTLSVYSLDKELTAFGPISVRDHPVALASDKKNIFVLTDNILYRYDKTIALADVYQTPDARAVRTVGSRILYATNGKLAEVKE